MQRQWKIRKEHVEAFNLNAYALEWIREEDAMALRNGCRNIRMKEKTGKEIRKLNA